MRVSISYPPLESAKGIPLLSQNRQFQWFHNPTYIYPIVPAYAATLLKNEGYEVSWDDGIAQGWTLPKYYREMEKTSPDLILIETKTPVVQTHWGIIDRLKEVLPETKVVLVGDHVTALPQESMEMSRVDYILTGGDYDFLLRNLCDHLERGATLEPGIWYRQGNEVMNTGPFVLDHDLDSLPSIDRDLTKWWLYQRNGNFKFDPGTYTMVGRDCWYGRCRFCSWTSIYPRFRSRKVESLLDEIGLLIDRYGVREVFDDTGTFPTGKWLERFCRGMIERGYNEKVRISCNMRVNAIGEEQFVLMRKAGFRMLLFGLESANQATLDRLDKGIQVEDISRACGLAKRAGLEPHLTIMIGYPWETKDDALQTLGLAKDIFRRGWADSLQATIVVPYPGTKLFEECREKGWLKTEDWSRYDMRENVMKTPMTAEEIKELTRSLYRVFLTPRYILRRIASLRGLDDLRFVKKGVKAVIGHLTDFATTREAQEKQDPEESHA